MPAEIPKEIGEAIEAAARRAVIALRDAVGVGISNVQQVRITDQIVVRYCNEVAALVSEDIGLRFRNQIREHLRQVVLEVFDRFIEGQV